MNRVQAIPYHKNSEALFNLIRDLPYACWLDSGKPNSHFGRYDIISALPSTRLVTQDGITSIYQRATLDRSEELLIQSEVTPLSLLEAELSKLSKRCDEQELPFSGGAIGYFGYDLHRHCRKDIDSPNKPQASSASETNTSAEKKPKSRLPDMHAGIYHWAIVQDHETQCSYLATLEECDKSIHDLIQLRLKQNKPIPEAQKLNVGELKPSIEREEYLKQLAKIKQYILAGDCYQVNFAQCFKAQYEGEPYSAYSKLRSVMASPFSAYLSLSEPSVDTGKKSNQQAIMSLSPERFLKTKSDKVLTQPIKGTAPRAQSPIEDLAEAEDLQTSEKNRAENLMIVDLLRNDLGQHCQPGSITVDTLFGLQSFPNVHHLVSDITGTLQNGSKSIDLLKDCFPGGSITGAPKKRAMEIIEELENRYRGVYCGSIGYINNNGDMDTNIAIRTVSCDGDSLYCWGGGGIVADSVPEEEYQESLNKIKAILRTLQTV
ncbi:MAG: aminodeoxychorismate synthase component I [Cellvibrionaceae bacterium]